VPETALSNRRSALLLAHPGHELLVLTLVRRIKPLVTVLTDGSGSQAESRLTYSKALLAACGARTGAVFGAFSDKAGYERIQAGDAGYFVALRDRIAEDYLAAGIEAVISDALEYYNPMHDLACVLADGVARRLAQRRGEPVLRAVIPIRPRGEVARWESGPDIAELDLTAQDRVFKSEAFEDYQPLASEIRSTREREGEGALREFLSPHEAMTQAEPSLAFEPFYESWGRRRIAEGVYTTLITYQDDVRPIAEAILRES